MKTKMNTKTKNTMMTTKKMALKKTKMKTTTTKWKKKNYAIESGQDGDSYLWRPMLCLCLELYVQYHLRKLKNHNFKH
ncbi:Protein of unknown function [Gryllus bimaculatus]|nr:Protein of unknown function [Gryllus bimaculatus]